MKQRLKNLLPTRVYLVAQRILNATKVLTAPLPDFYCPICETRVTGMWSGFNMNYVLACPRCQSLSRQRLIVRYLLDHRDLIDGAANILHFAAEPCLVDTLRRMNPGLVYDTADLHRPATLQVDIERTGLPANRYALVMANHVLEHVDDDKAIAEMFRILDEGGVAIVTVPLISAWESTYEDPHVPEQDRERHFGQGDHVRYYGRDLRTRFEENGFSVHEHVASGADCVAFGLDRGEVLFLLTKGPGQPPGHGAPSEDRSRAEG